MSNQSQRPLKVGLFLPIADQWMAGDTAFWKDIKTMALHAEAVGFDSIWINDHLIFEFGGPDEPKRGVWECWSLLSALAAITSRVEVGTAVVCTGFRNPALLAKAADAVDNISGGQAEQVVIHSENFEKRNVCARTGIRYYRDRGFAVVTLPEKQNPCPNRSI